MVSFEVDLGLEPGGWAGGGGVKGGEHGGVGQRRPAGPRPLAGRGVFQRLPKLGCLFSTTASSVVGASWAPLE